MSNVDPIADMLTRLRNGMLIKMKEVVIPYSALKENIVKLFRDEGYIKDYKVLEENNKKSLVVYLNYTDNGEPTIRGLKMVSLPSRRVYVKPKNMRLVLGGLGTGLISTSKGIKTIKECRKVGIGGEYICEIW
jgi:small subunit ribosomal protein S8